MREARSLACIIDLLRTGVSGRGAVYGPMAAVVQHSLQEMTMTDPIESRNPRPYGMPPFYPVLSDDEVAAVVTYIRQSWGNNAPPTWSVEVQRSRGVPAD